MTLLEDLKNLPETLKAYNIVAEIKTLKNEVEALKSWKNQSAIPQFDELYKKTASAANEALNAADKAINASNIANAAQNATVDIQNWINNEAIPNINTALSDAQAAAQKALDASALAESIRNAVQSMATEVENAKNKIFQIRDVFIRIGNIIKARIDNIQRLISELYDLIVNGMYSINNNAVYTANRIKQWGEIIVANGEYIFAQSQDAINEINVPLERVEHYANILANPDIFDLPWTFYNVYMAFAHTVFLSHAEEASFKQEIKEGFNQTFSAVRDFGTDLESAFKDWMNNFKILFADMKDKFNAIASKMAELNQEVLGLFSDIQVEIKNLEV